MSVCPFIQYNGNVEHCLKEKCALYVKVVDGYNHNAVGCAFQIIAKKMVRIAK